MSPPLENILLTGATGFLGSHILRTALAQQKYHVRIVVRSEAKAASLRSSIVLSSITTSPLPYSFHVVPDFAAPGALDAAAADCTAIIHAAAPLPWDETLSSMDANSAIVVPGINSVLAVLETAARTPSVKRVIYTSSGVAFISPAILFGPEETPSNYVYKSTDRIDATLLGPPFPDLATAYVAGKSTGLAAAEAYMRESHPHFDLVVLAPPYIIGRNDLIVDSKALETNTSNSRWFSLLKGVSPDSGSEASATDGSGSAPAVSLSSSVEDVALLHVLALPSAGRLAPVSKNQGSTRVFVFGNNIQWDDIVKVAKERFPAVVEKGWIRGAEKQQQTKEVVMDNADVEGAFGIELQGLEGMVDSLVGQWMEMLEKEQRKA